LKPKWLWEEEKESTINIYQVKETELFPSLEGVLPDAALEAPRSGEYRASILISSQMLDSFSCMVRNETNCTGLAIYAQPCKAKGPIDRSVLHQWWRARRASHSKSNYTITETCGTFQIWTLERIQTSLTDRGFAEKKDGPSDPREDSFERFFRNAVGHWLAESLRE